MANDGLLSMKDAIAKVVQGKHLTREETSSVMATIMDGQASDAQIASFITALRMKGETIEEITGWHSADDAGKQAILIAAAQRVALSQPSYSSVPRKSDLDRSN